MYDDGPIKGYLAYDTVYIGNSILFIYFKFIFKIFKKII